MSSDPSWNSVRGLDNGPAPPNQVNHQQTGWNPSDGQDRGGPAPPPQTITTTTKNRLFRLGPPTDDTTSTAAAPQAYTKTTAIYTPQPVTTSHHQQQTTTHSNLVLLGGNCITIPTPHHPQSQHSQQHHHAEYIIPSPPPAATTLNIIQTPPGEQWEVLNLPGRGAIPFAVVRAPVSLTFRELFGYLGGKPENSSVVELTRGSSTGVWYAGVQVSGFVEGDLERRLGEVGWDSCLRGGEAVWVHFVKG
ncbi:hypothetical protein QBC47DRAFT_443709 [Echria macrotheca]|uniref:Uncharacterized protein n=1 Tax=Echria macrotheca TaxID=438768 RepID=A0AAJ0F6M0_9PEZI|nr:hypothetical protein QBC47DRAFT_443709 [Echria macrotheca]